VNASIAANQNRILTVNGTIGRHINATFVNGTWVDPNVTASGQIIPVPEPVDPLLDPSNNATASIENTTYVEPQVRCITDLPLH